MEFFIYIYKIIAEEFKFEMLLSVNENEKSLDHFNSFQFSKFCTFTYFLNNNVLFKLMVTELNMDLEASLSV